MSDEAEPARAVGLSDFLSQLEAATKGVEKIPRPDGKRGRTGRVENLRIATVLHVALRVAVYADIATGEHAYPGIERLATATGLSADAVRQSLAVLREYGWLVRVSRGNRRSGQADEYRLAIGRPFEAGDATAESQGPEAGDDAWVAISEEEWRALPQAERDMCAPNFDGDGWLYPGSTLPERDAEHCPSRTVKLDLFEMIEQCVTRDEHRELWRRYRGEIVADEAVEQAWKARGIALWRAQTAV